MFSGVAALFPVVPLYVRAHGGSSADVALFVAGPLVASTLIQIPAGHLVDRLGRKPVLVASRVLFAALSFALFADWGPLWWLALLRVGQGACSGAYLPALRASLADLTPEGGRSQRYAQLQACEMVGLLIGPALGGAIALWRISGIFAAAGVSVLVGLGTLVRMPETRGLPSQTMPLRGGGGHTDVATPRAPSSPRPSPRRWWLHRSLLVPAAALAAVGAMFNMYDVVWPQYLNVRGYDSLVIGLSISLFAVPILLLAGRGGRLGDRWNRRALIPGALSIVAACAVSYPELRNIFPILAVGTVEATAFVVIEPTLYAIVSETAHERIRGRALGLAGLFEAGGGALGAGVLGSLYGVSEPLPFLGGAAACLAAATLCAFSLPAHRARELAHPEPIELTRPEIALH
jgi:DHA1 family multidrug resistance protein-like MFS transporter